MRSLSRLGFVTLMAALVTVLATGGSVIAHPTDLDVDPTGDLNSPSRTTAAVAGTIVCTAGEDATIKVKIFQSVGRLLNIGLGTVAVVCNGAIQTWGPFSVAAIPGLKFQPGPSTVLVEATTAVGGVPDAGGTMQIGARLNLTP